MAGQPLGRTRVRAVRPESVNADEQTTYPPQWPKTPMKSASKKLVNETPRPSPSPSVHVVEPRPMIRPLTPLEGAGFYYNLQAKDIMTREVVSILEDATLLDALDLLRSRNISGLPVTDAGGKLVGVLSERDIGRVVSQKLELGHLQGGLAMVLASMLRRPEATLQKMRELVQDRKVGAVMTRDVCSVTPESTLEDVARLLMNYHINRLPVVAEGKVVGIIARDDVLRRGVLSYPTGTPEIPELAPESTPRQARRPV